MADVASLERALTPRLLRDSREDFTSAPVVMLDGNLSAESLQVGYQAGSVCTAFVRHLASRTGRHDHGCVKSSSLMFVRTRFDGGHSHESSPDLRCLLLCRRHAAWRRKPACRSGSSPSRCPNPSGMLPEAQLLMGFARRARFLLILASWVSNYPSLRP